MILLRFIYYSGKFHTDTINQTVFTKEFVKLVWGKMFLPNLVSRLQYRLFLPSKISIPLAISNEKSFF